MEPDAGYKSCYIASILMRSDAYEAELNGQILAGLRNRTLLSEISSPAILPSSPNRVYFIERFLSGLTILPFAVEMLTKEQEIDQQIGAYDAGRPDPVNPAGTWRAMSLDMRMALGADRNAKVFIRELSSEQHVLISFAFDPDTVNGGIRHKDASRNQAGNLPRLREFLLALAEACPVLVGTLGTDLDALNAVLPDGESQLENRLSLDQLTGVVRLTEHGHKFDFAVITPAAAGGDRPFVYNRIEPLKSVQEIEAGGKYHDLRLVETLRQHAERAEKAYDGMYGSNYPKDDRDDALGHLSGAIELAGSLGLADIETGLKERYEHIHAVFNSQFRR